MVLTALGCAAKMRAMLQTSSSGCAPVVAAKTWTCSANRERQTAMRFCRRYCSKPSLARLRDSVWAEVEHTARLEPKGRETEYASTGDKSTMTHNMRHVPAGAKKAETRAQTSAVASAPTFRPTRGLREAMLETRDPSHHHKCSVIHHRCPSSTGASRRSTSATGWPYQNVPTSKA